MQPQFWARNLAPQSTTEIVFTRPLTITNVSISSDIRNAFARTSLLLSMVLKERTSPSMTSKERISPLYTVATLVVGRTEALQINVRLDPNVKYVFTVNGANSFSVIGYYSAEAAPQTIPPTLRQTNLGFADPPSAVNGPHSVAVAPRITLSSETRGSQTSQAPASNTYATKEQRIPESRAQLLDSNNTMFSSSPKSTPPSTTPLVPVQIQSRPPTVPNGHLFPQFSAPHPIESGLGQDTPLNSQTPNLDPRMFGTQYGFMRPDNEQPATKKSKAGNGNPDQGQMPINDRGVGEETIVNPSVVPNHNKKRQMTDDSGTSHNSPSDTRIRTPNLYPHQNPSAVNDPHGVLYSRQHAPTPLHAASDPRKIARNTAYSHQNAPAPVHATNESRGTPNAVHSQHAHYSTPAPMHATDNFCGPSTDPQHAQASRNTGYSHHNTPAPLHSTDDTCGPSSNADHLQQNAPGPSNKTNDHRAAIAMERST
ncbi:hypothetical protein C8J55DRAFT_566626 [Lentinula edodes]|uniref:Nucleoplasmin-like domain-containing protein n=1 Tax=Lentinula lateritia TaxID=40482 RepID=A0A9W8ZSE8_9AGAR|nr:hypothetical protein C8J55DRAFT_566620 [Lentinula edodes]KAJ4464915.1 hypothetical protein C8J55DRAFT_566626 [Lentinula edodes]